MYPSPSFRASDADREAVVAHLSAAAAEGRLSLSEFSERTRHVYTSRTWGDLLRIVRDLPPIPIAPKQQAPVWPVLALIFGIVSVPLAFCAPVGAAAGLAGIVFGVLGQVPATRGPGHQRGIALAGLICGVFGVALAIAFAWLIAVGDA